MWLRLAMLSLTKSGLPSRTGFDLTVVKGSEGYRAVQSGHHPSAQTKVNCCSKAKKFFRGVDRIRVKVCPSSSICFVLAPSPFCTLQCSQSSGQLERHTRPSIGGQAVTSRSYQPGVILKVRGTEQVIEFPYPLPARILSRMSGRISNWAPLALRLSLILQ